MSTQVINLRFTQSPVSSTTQGSFGSRLWENLTFSSPGYSSTLLKVVGIAIVFWLLGFACGVRWSRLQSSSFPQKNPEPNTEPNASSSSIIQKEADKEPLPHGIKEENVKSFLEYIQKNRVSEKKKSDAEQTVEEYKAIISKTQMFKFCQGMERNNSTSNFLNYLVSQKHIKRYQIMLGRAQMDIVVWF